MECLGVFKTSCLRNQGTSRTSKVKEISGLLGPPVRTFQGFIWFLDTVVFGGSLDSVLSFLGVFMIKMSTV